MADRKNITMNLITEMRRLLSRTSCLHATLIIYIFALAPVYLGTVELIDPAYKIGDMLFSSHILSNFNSALLAVAMISYVDIAFDSYDINTSSSNPSVERKKVLVYERFLAATTMAICAICYLSQNAFAVVLSVKFANFVQIYLQFHVMSLSKTNVWSHGVMNFISLTFCIARICTFYISSSSYVFECSILLTGVTGLTICYVAFFKYFKVVDLKSELFGSDCSNEGLVCMSVLFCIFAFVQYIVLLSIFPGQSPANGSEGYYISLIAAFVLYTLPLVFLPGKHAKSVLSKTKIKLEVASSVVNYVGRELSIPMTSLSLCLPIVQETFNKASPSLPFSTQRELSQLFSEIKDSLETASTMIKNVSTIESLESTLLTSMMSNVRVSTFVFSTINELFGIAAKKKMVTLDMSACHSQTFSNTYVSMDPSKIALVLSNLVSNALKFTEPAGKISVSFRIVAEEVQVESCAGILICSSNRVGVDGSFPGIRSFLRFEVRDTGIGTSAEVMNYLTTGEVWRIPSGLGLQISKKIIDFHHGRIGVFSSGKCNEGSIYFFDLPYDPNRPHPNTPTTVEDPLSLGNTMVLVGVV